MEAHLIKVAFEKADANSNGRIGRKELMQVFQELDAWTEADLNDILDAVDVNRDGSIKYTELVDWIMTDDDDEVQDEAKDDLLEAADNEDYDPAEQDALENAEKVERANINLSQKVSEKEFIMLLRRLELDEDDAAIMYRRTKKDLEEEGESTDGGVPLIEFIDDLHIQPEDQAALANLGAKLAEVQKQLGDGIEDEALLDPLVLRPAVNILVRELIQAQRPMKDAWNFFKECDVPLSHAGALAIEGFASKQRDLVKMCEDFYDKPPALTCASGQTAIRQRCVEQVQRIVDKCKADGTKFTDPAWNMTSRSDEVLYVDKHAPGYDCTVGKPSGYKRLTELIKGSPTKRAGMSLFSLIPSAAHGPVLFKGGVRPGDIVQGQIGTCFLLGALGAVVSNNAKAVKKAFLAYDIEVGVYGVRFCVDGEWKYVIVDDYMPVDDMGDMLYARSKDPSEIWCCLLEKAFCKLHTCYEMCDGGRPDEAMYSLVGGCSGKLVIEKKHLANPRIYFNVLDSARDKGYILTTTFVARKNKARGQGKCGEAVLPSGLVGGHVYSVLRVAETQGNRLVCCRNPWGTGEWTGRWSDKNQFGEWTDEVKQAAGYSDENNGEFWMSIEDFVANSGGVEYARTFGPPWKKITLVRHFSKGVMQATAQYAYEARADDEISIERGSILDVDSLSAGWWYGRVAGTDKRGYFPGNYVKLHNRPIARFDLTGTPNEGSSGSMVAVVVLSQPNILLKRRFHKRKEDGLNYKDTTYSNMQLVVVDPDGKVVVKLSGAKRELSSEFQLKGSGTWKIYAEDFEGLGEEFQCRVYFRDGSALLDNVPDASLDELHGYLTSK